MKGGKEESEEEGTKERREDGEGESWGGIWEAGKTEKKRRENRGK